MQKTPKQNYLMVYINILLFWRIQVKTTKIFGVLFLLLGLALAIPGLWLVALGGSLYYAVMGIGLCATGYWYFKGNRAGIAAFAAVYAVTVIWAIWEVWGMDSWFWPLIPRLLAPSALGAVALALAPRLANGSLAWFSTKTLYAAGAAMAAVFIGQFAGMFYKHGVIQNSTAFSADAQVMAKTVAAGNDWPEYGRTSNGTRFAPFNQINPETVKDLKVAWTYQHGETPVTQSADQNTPMVVDKTLYYCSISNNVHALNSETGALLWKFEPGGKPSPYWRRCRGVTSYKPATLAASADVACASRVVLTTSDARLIQIDAHTGKRCESFGVNGEVDLKAAMGEVKAGFYFSNTAPTVMGDLILLGGWVADNVETGEPSGAVRAFNALTGQLVWAWDVGRPGQTGLPAEGTTYTRGTPNVWSTPAYDTELGLVYLPTGNATPDFWGGERRTFDDENSSSIVALDIKTGQVRWKFQTVHHDLWDYDVPSQPALYDVPNGKGGTTPALFQTTKRGQIFMLDRRDGKPIAEVLERAVPQDVAKGDRISPTQPYSVGMPSIGAEPLTEAQMWGATPLDQLYCRIVFQQSLHQGDLIPPNLKQQIQYPGFFGGFNWGSASIDESRGLLIVNDIRLPIKMKLLPRAVADAMPYEGPHGSTAKMWGTPYGVEAMPFMSPLGVPCNQPPYGTLTAIDLSTRKVAWQTPVGTVKETGPLGIKMRMPIEVGMPTLGGPVSTAGGLVFFSGTQDYFLRALDAKTGLEVWKGALPVGSQATPATYLAPNGQQYVVVTASGSADSPEKGDYIVAFSLGKK